MGSAFAAGAGDDAGEGFVGEEGAVVGHVAVADFEELVFGFGSSHLVHELAFGVDALTDEVEVLLHLVDLSLFWGVRLFDGGVEVFDVAVDLVKGDFGYGEACLVFADLAEDPGVANGVASDHDAGGSGVVEDLAGFGGGGDVAVGEQGAVDAFGGAFDEVVVDLGAVHFLDGATVQAEEVDLVLVDEVEDGFEVLGVFEADAHFDGEESGDGLAEGAEDLVDFLRVAEESAAAVLFVDGGGGAAHVEIDAGDGVVLQVFGGAGEVEDVFADHLGEDGAAGVVFRDGFEDVFFKARLDVDAEVLGDEVVGGAAVGDDGHERAVGDVLHGGEGSERLSGLNGGGKGSEIRTALGLAH